MTRTVVFVDCQISRMFFLKMLIICGYSLEIKGLHFHRLNGENKKHFFKKLYYLNHMVSGSPYNQLLAFRNLVLKLQLKQPLITPILPQ